MKPKYDMSMIEIQNKGYEILCEHLGIVGMLKFIQQFDLGSGDYTKEREKILGNPTIDEIKAEIELIKNNSITRQSREK